MRGLLYDFKGRHFLTIEGQTPVSKGKEPVVKYCLLTLKLNSSQIGSSHFFVWPEVTSHCLLTHQNKRGSLFHNVCSVYIPHFVGLMTHVRGGTKINRGHGGQKREMKIMGARDVSEKIDIA